MYVESERKREREAHAVVNIIRPSFERSSYERPICMSFSDTYCTYTVFVYNVFKKALSALLAFARGEKTLKATPRSVSFDNVTHTTANMKRDVFLSSEKSNKPIKKFNKAAK